MKFKMPIGKYRGMKVCDLPTSYLVWYRDRGPRFGLRMLMVEELYRRMYQG